MSVAFSVMKINIERKGNSWIRASVTTLQHERLILIFHGTVPPFLTNALLLHSPSTETFLNKLSNYTWPHFNYLLNAK